ncbi:tetratricopeptide repeat protein [Tundrisphaera lichenicola]|uniref:tetratricopeptide repeat protein n=1 Tax=Tundrisphaera lichenicola TaxID=2029860 RepID=UPI003EC0DF29
MTEPESDKPLPRSESEGDLPADETPVEAPAPEPWTPRRVFEWNSYYDLYVAGFVVLLAFLGSANKIQPINSSIWSLLHAGRQSIGAGSPVVTNTWTIAGEGARWVNISWLFEVIHYGLHSAVASIVPPPEPGMPTPLVGGPAEQYAAGALIALSALIRGLTAWLLMGLRRKGPGLWWAAICATLAVGVTLGPASVESFAPTADGEVIRTVRPTIDVSPGGIAGPAAVSPENWGLFFFAIELLLLHHAMNLGKTGRLFWLVPLFVVWANMDENYAFGLVVLAAAVVGLGFGKPREEARPSLKSGLIALAACFGVTFASPSHVFGVLAAFSSIYRAVGLDFGPPSPVPISVFGTGLGADFSRSFQIYYVALVGLGLISFLLNRRNFSLGRFLMFVVSAALWALALNYTAMFGCVFAATLALNGQEWYLDTFGAEGRLGAGWALWSTGGRLVTISLVFAAITSGVTGWGREVGESQFGFGFNPDDFPFEAAEAVKAAPIEGNILNTTRAQGDALAWRTGGRRKAFLDSRLHLYSRDIFLEWDKVRRAIRDDQVEVWQPVLDQSKISAIMLRPSGADSSPVTYARLLGSPHWIPFYDDGAVVMFGRSDPNAPATDLAYFKANRLDAEALAYQRPRPVPPWERPPTPTYEPIDSIFKNRLLNRPQPHTDAARRWLRPADVPPGTSYLPDPAHCLMAIREARAALSAKPDDVTAFRWLFEAYRLLLTQESALIAGLAPTPENMAQILQTPIQPRALGNRFRQLLTALNFTIQTLPPAKTLEERIDKVNLNFTLAQYYIQAGAYDLARERLSAIEPREGEMDEEFFKNLTRLLGELNQRVEGIQNQMSDLVINNQATPLDQANFARSQGAPSLAIRELEELNDAGTNPAAVRPLLVDLYCDSGMPEKALEVIGPLNVDDPSLSTGVGTAAYRQGQVYFLLGNYENAVTLWRDKSVAQLRTQRGLMAPVATQMLLNGDPVASTRMLLELPEKVDQQAQWEFELGLAVLEGGLSPEVAAEHFTSALKLEPNLLARPVIAYYLEKLGKPVPPPTTVETPAPATPATEPTPAPATPATEPAPKPEAAEEAKPTDAPKPEEAKPADAPKG